MRKRSLAILSSGFRTSLFAIAAILAPACYGQVLVDTDTTRNGGTFNGGILLTINGPTTPELHLTNGAQTTNLFTTVIGYEDSGAVVVDGGSDMASQWNTFEPMVMYAPGQYIYTGNTYLGLLENSSGTLKVSGEGSTYSNSWGISVGNLGSGELNIELGGNVGTYFSAIAEQTGSIGTVTVSGPDSVYYNQFSMWVGDRGNGSLTVSDGGYVYADNITTGLFEGSVGKTTVVGSGSMMQSLNFVEVGYAGAGELNIEDGGTVESFTGLLGTTALSQGTVKISGEDSSWKVRTMLDVGNAGTGNITVEDGGLLTSAFARVGIAKSGMGSVTVTGAGSEWDNGNFALVLGLQGDGELKILDGGVVRTGSIFSGTGQSIDGTVTNDGKGTVTVDGQGSQLILTASSVGLASNGSLTVSNGGSVLAPNADYLIVGGDQDFANMSAVMEVTGAGSLISARDYIEVGVDPSIEALGTATLILNDGGTASAGTALRIRENGTLAGDGGIINANVVNYGTIAPGQSPGILTINGNLQSTGKLNLEIGSINDFDRLVISGNLFLEGVVDINLLNGYIPTIGTSFDLLDFAAFNPGFNGTFHQFDFTDAALSSGLQWDTSDFAKSGSISVVAAVPEPTSVVVLALGMFSVPAIRRYRRNHSQSLPGRASEHSS